MAAQEYATDTVVIQTDEPLEYIALLSKGSVRATLPTGELLLKMGDIIGITDLSHGKHCCTYTTLEPSTLIMYPCKTVKELSDIVYGNHDIALIFATSIIRQTCDICDAYVMSTFFSDKLYQYLQESYEDYKKLCLQYAQPAKTLEGIEAIKPFRLQERLESWISDYYEALKSLDSHTKAQMYQSNPALCMELLCRASSDVHHIYDISSAVNDYNAQLSSLLLNSQRLDLFSLLTELYVSASQNGTDSLALDATIGKLSIQLEGNPSIDSLYYHARLNECKEIISKAKVHRQADDALDEDDPSSVIKSTTISALSGSLYTILQYADCPEEITERFQQKIIAYKQLPDKNSDDDGTRKLRLEIAKLFYEIYDSVFQISIADKNIPPIIKMFLTFGYVDEVLCGIENAVYLYSIIDDYKGDASKGVYTFYEWLLAIYHGKKEPSRNEFDVDYTAYVHELKITGQIPPDVETRMLSDTSQKVMFELRNMFPIVNKVTFGRITTFCPILSEQNILKNLDSALVTVEKVTENLNLIRSTDHTVFYHESIYADENLNIGKQYVHTEIVPDIVLMPNVGIRGVMWQEIEGRNRQTPARMMVSAFCLSDLDLIFTRLTGEYRWEMCKRVQGARWNDVSDPSITSLYTDYLQFYRKNNDLSTQAKELVKVTLQKAKNNFREVFIQDYAVWITYESKGSPRLSKVVRNILFQFCPFSKDIRSSLSSNPLYTDIIKRYENRNHQDTERLHKLIMKLEASGADVPEAVQSELKYLAL